ncbi:hypothetical protein QN277_026246 [Acacia crassicarpa]|uniref:Uncharacterized protein n=1 Tax=Acacia crassicarpa TaxID=499986 RepID=A0AAE1K6C7_9FABA|nr:hypothetical protein QN277_026246 [Acacia crassicarpa]
MEILYSTPPFGESIMTWHFTYCNCAPILWADTMKRE